MKLITYSDKVNKKIKVIPSKSIIIRVLAAIFLSEKRSRVLNRTYCDDELSAIKLLRDLGTDLKTENIIQFNAFGETYSKKIDFGESGFLTRTFSLILSSFHSDFLLTGQKTLKNRRFEDLIKTLKKLEVDVKSSNCKLPFEIKGPLKKKNISLDCSKTSQILSGLLMLFAKLKKNSYIEAKNPVSKPYIDLTIDVLKDFGVEIENDKYNRFYVKGSQDFEKIDYFIEGDWSAASFWAVLAALKGKIVMKNLNIDSKQGDKIILDILKEAGADVSVREDKVAVEKNSLNSFDFDATDYPDLIPALTVLGLNCEGKSKISGINRLINKESNRLRSILEEFKKLGAGLEVDGDTLIVKKSRLHSGIVKSHNDHRIAMALAVAAKNINGGIKLQDWMSVNKSYPGFFAELESL
ncbi:MAG: 3-phosphoshikimate 1-carboxyvinyltransferase [Candidatus Mcinerneyibacterium aminivorans]|uniref:3-phosphoshikimate 1-carboxyvinyltransferase n=1 Tax=Candidatus Mcinerneyibacterium aminivorans TaxID=2703815 RepID=A0A5D0M9N1_9BACT|nr:MAG: 3-phosphoshikimate 1-carboxyvinyltransferase [Candidatus Mcinerneyibacterium aminivorans]